MKLVSSTASPSSRNFSTSPATWSPPRKRTPPEEDEDRGKAAITELFQEVKNDSTPVVVARIVNDIDEIVRLVRFPGWQQTSAGEREVKNA